MPPLPTGPSAPPGPLSPLSLSPRSGPTSPPATHLCGRGNSCSIKSSSSTTSAQCLLRLSPAPPAPAPAVTCGSVPQPDRSLLNFNIKNACGQARRWQPGGVLRHHHRGGARWVAVGACRLKSWTVRLFRAGQPPGVHRCHVSCAWRTRSTCTHGTQAERVNQGPTCRES